MKKKNLLIFALVLAGLGIIGSAMAFLTDVQTVRNTFTVGGVKITLTEPNWDAENANSIVPGKEFAKDPTIKNIGTNDAYVFMKVVVPYESVRLEGASTAAFKQLFNYTLNTGWVEVGTAVTDESAKTITHVYGYATSSSANMTTLAKNGTAKLFDSVTFENLKNTEGLSSTLNLDVTAYAIQTENVATAPTAANVWAVLTANLS